MLALISDTGLAQSVERQPFKLVVEGSSPSFGEYLFMPLRIVVFEHFAIIEYPDQSALLDLAEPSRAIHIRSMQRLSGLSFTQSKSSKRKRQKENHYLLYVLILLHPSQIEDTERLITDR